MTYVKTLPPPEFSVCSGSEVDFLGEEIGSPKQLDSASSARASNHGRSGPSGLEQAPKSELKDGTVQICDDQFSEPVPQHHWIGLREN